MKRIQILDNGDRINQDTSLSSGDDVAILTHDGLGYSDTFERINATHFVCQDVRLRDRDIKDLWVYKVD